jgi:hypothetical protein
LRIEREKEQYPYQDLVAHGWQELRDSRTGVIRRWSGFGKW